MKRSTKVLLLIILLLVVVILTFFVIYITSNSNKKEEENLVNIYEEVSTVDEIKEEEKVPEYIDENQVKLGIYVQDGNNLRLVDEEYTCSWEPENIMGLFYVVPTTEKTISFLNFDTMWKNYIEKYLNASKCRIGYNLKFTLNNGELIDSTILNPTDAYYMFPKVMVFLYDDVNLIPGKPYYHIENMTDETICSSIKLVGDVESKNITSNIELTAFCFDSDDDFDPVTKKYRGNSSYTITISK